MNPIEIYRRTPERDQILRPHRSHVPPEQIRQSPSEEIPKHADTPMYEYCGEFKVSVGEIQREEEPPADGIPDGDEQLQTDDFSGFFFASDDFTDRNFEFATVAGGFRGNCAVSAAAADGRIGGNDDPVHFPVDPDTVTGNKLIPPHPVNDLVDLVPELCRVDRGE